jgi:hypothetical protein
MTAALMFRYLEWIEPFLPPQRPFLLFTDQHESRFADEVLALCRSKRIHLMALPPGLTWLVQPVDLTVHRSYKRNLSAALSDFIADQHLASTDVVAVQWQAYDRAYSKKNIVNGFEKAGIWPFNPDRVLQGDEVKRILRQHEEQELKRSQQQLQQQQRNEQEVERDEQHDDRMIDELLAPPDLPVRAKRKRRTRGFRSGGLLTSDVNTEKIRVHNASVKNSKKKNFFRFNANQFEPEDEEPDSNNHDNSDEDRAMPAADDLSDAEVRDEPMSPAERKDDRADPLAAPAEPARRRLTRLSALTPLERAAFDARQAAAAYALFARTRNNSLSRNDLPSDFVGNQIENRQRSLQSEVGWRRSKRIAAALTAAAVTAVLTKAARKATQQMMC